jgi:hypothetical protein
VADDPNGRAIVLHHLAAKVHRCDARYDERTFLAHNRREWARLCRAMGGDEAHFPYPFSAQGAFRRKLEAFVAGTMAGWRRWRLFGAAHRAPEPPQPSGPTSRRPALDRPATEGGH